MHKPCGAQLPAALTKSQIYALVPNKEGAGQGCQVLPFCTYLEETRGRGEPQQRAAQPRGPQMTSSAETSELRLTPPLGLSLRATSFQASSWTLLRLTGGNRGQVRRKGLCKWFLGSRWG